MCVEPFIDEYHDSTCAICSETMGLPNQYGLTEHPYKLPCSHIFGSRCILRWLQASPRQDCPNCRRRMVHRGCGHLIMPHNAHIAPPGIREEETPDLCVKCRGESALAQAMRIELERLQAQEKALRGIRSVLPRFFGGAAPRSLCNIEERIEELQKSFAVLHERAWREYELRERRERW